MGVAAARPAAAAEGALQPLWQSAAVRERRRLNLLEVAEEGRIMRAS